VAWRLVAGLSAGWIFFFGVFLLLMKEGYRPTFFSTTTGKQIRIDYFIKGVGDKGKSDVIGCNRKQWLAIKEDVKKWVQGKWWTWQDDKPAWFSDAWVSHVPLEFIPVEDRAKYDSLRYYRG